MYITAMHWGQKLCVGGSTPNASDQKASAANFAYGVLASTPIGEVNSVVFVGVEYEGLQ